MARQLATFRGYAASTGTATAPEPHLIEHLKKLEHQLKDLQKMVVADQPCHEIAQQMSSVRKAMDKTFYTLVLRQIVSSRQTSRNDEIVRFEITRSAHLLDRFG